MQKTMPVLLHFFALVSLVLLAACSAQAGIPGTGSNATSTNSASGTSGGSSTPGASSASTASPTVFPTISVITALPATSQPAGSGTASPGSVFTATPGATETTGQGLSVTLADEGKTVKLKVGQRFLLNLGADYNWSPTIADQSIVSRVIGILVIRGAQGIYEAHAPGTTTLTADGEPACRQSTPACMAPNRIFKVTLQVTP